MVWTKIREIWSDFRHRKVMFLMILFGSILATLGGCVILAPKKTEVAQQKNAQLAEATEEKAYNNSLNLRILGVDGQIACEMNFNDDFSKATLTIAETDLESAAYVRVLGTGGEVLAGEYTEIAETAGERVTYRFKGSPEAATVAVEPGTMVEIQAKEARVYSNLDGGEVGYFAPEQATERYVVMENGLRKAVWDEATGDEVMYGLLAGKLQAEIEDYQAGAAKEVVENKKLDVANKSRVKLAFYNLREADQAKYRDFITALEQGGKPKINYTGANGYRIGSEIAWRDLVTARDNEDGEISEIEVETNYDAGAAGEYYVRFRAQDSDGNVGELTQQIFVTRAEGGDVFNNSGDSDNAGEDFSAGGEEISRVEEKDLIAEVAQDEEAAGAENTELGFGGGQNAEEGEKTTKDAEETEDLGNVVIEDEELKRQPTGEYHQETKPNDSEEEAKGENEKSSHGWIIWVGVGAVVLLGLGKFVSDHYIR